MTANDLLDVIGHARGEYVLAADAPVEKKRLPHRKLMLIAAIVAVGLLLAGCAAVFLWLNDRSIGQETYTQRFDAEGHYIEPTEKTADVVTLFGSSGSNMQKALVEWHQFLEGYPSSWEMDLTEEEMNAVPERYRYTYNCHTMEMVEELERIAGKYGLKLLDTELGFQRYQYETALEGLGLSSILRPDAKATMENGQGFIRLPQNLSMEFFMDLTGVEEKWAKDIYVNYDYAQAAYFPGCGTATLDLTEYKQWKYTAADGTPLLLALNQKGKGLILAERKDAMIWIDVDSNAIGPNFPKPEDVISQEGFQQLADAFDYSIQPKVVDAAAVQAKLDADYEANWQEMLDSVATYAGFTDYVLENGHRYAKWDYILRDLDGDGTEEMVIYYNGQTPSCLILHMHEGQCREHIMFGSDFRLLENGGALSYAAYSDEETGSEIYYEFHPPKANGYPWTFHYNEYTSGATTETPTLSVIYREGVWKKCLTNRWDEGTVISEDEAQKIIAQYPEEKLDWQPLWDYPVDAEGTTLGQVLSQRKNPATWEEGLEFYRAALQAGEAYLGDSTHFALRDIDGDGAIDLLVSSDGEQIREIYICRYGKAVFFTMGKNYLCEGGVLLGNFTSPARDGADVESYTYLKRSGTSWEEFAAIERNKANGQWTDVKTGKAITAEEAQAVIDRYPRIELDFHPVAELRG